MNVGLVDIDGHNFPNYALMKISAYHKKIGDSVNWVDIGNYDRTYMSKVFTFSPDYSKGFANYGEIIKGGTGYDIASKLPIEIESSKLMDYSIYPQYNYSIQFLSRGCIRNCKFCLVRGKEGFIKPVEPVELNPNGKWIEVLDNNFFANTEWKSSIDYLIKQNQPVNLHGVDIRIMNEEQAFWLNKLRLKRNIHIAWDLPELDLTDKLNEVIKYISPNKICCYVLVGFNSTVEQDMFRLRKIKELGITPFVQPFRDFENIRKPQQYEKDLARWANKMWTFKSCEFADFQPRKGFRCRSYLNSFEKTEERGQKIK
jgi:hypothetical protein